MTFIEGEGGLAWRCYDGRERDVYVASILAKKLPYNPDFPMTDPTITTVFKVLFNEF